MSAPLLYPLRAPDAVAFVMAHLRPIVASPLAIGANRWQAGTILPYRMVLRVTGPRSAMADFPVVRVHTFGADVNQAYREGNDTDARMQKLVDDPLYPVDMGEGVLANCSWCEITEAAHEVEYKSKSVVTQVVSEYSLKLPLVPIPA